MLHDQLFYSGNICQAIHSIQVVYCSECWHDLKLNVMRVFSVFQKTLNSVKSTHVHFINPITCFTCLEQGVLMVFVPCLLDKRFKCSNQITALCDCTPKNIYYYNSRSSHHSRSIVTVVMVSFIIDMLTYYFYYHSISFWEKRNCMGMLLKYAPLVCT